MSNPPSLKLRWINIKHSMSDIQEKKAIRQANIAEKDLTASGADTTIEINYGIIVGSITLFGLAGSVVGLAGLAKEARKTIISEK